VQVRCLFCRAPPRMARPGSCVEARGRRHSRPHAGPVRRKTEHSLAVEGAVYLELIEGSSRTPNVAGRNFNRADERPACLLDVGFPAAASGFRIFCGRDVSPPARTPRACAHDQDVGMSLLKQSRRTLGRSSPSRCPPCPSLAVRATWPRERPSASPPNAGQGGQTRQCLPRKGRCRHRHSRDITGLEKTAHVLPRTAGAPSRPAFLVALEMQITFFSDLRRWITSSRTAPSRFSISRARKLDRTQSQAGRRPRAILEGEDVAVDVRQHADEPRTSRTPSLWTS